jgi:hypothetical protein
MNHYHATVDQPSRLTARHESAARRQDDLVLAWFRARPHVEASPEDVHAAVLPLAPLTSARRSITNLTARGLLEKLQHTRAGQYGRPVHVWRLRTNEPRQGRLL